MKCILKIIGRNNQRFQIEDEFKEICINTIQFLEKILSRNIPQKIIYAFVSINENSETKGFTGKNIIFLNLTPKKLKNDFYYKKVLKNKDMDFILKFSLTKILAHEVTHIFFNTIDLPFWISEGIAEYLSIYYLDFLYQFNLLQIYRDKSEEIYHELKLKEDLLQNFPLSKKVSFGYLVSFLAISDIINEFSYSLFQEVIDSKEINISNLLKRKIPKVRYSWLYQKIDLISKLNCQNFDFRFNEIK